MTGRSPWQVLQDVLRSDAAAPRVTFYERTPGPTCGERIELSGKVLVNWVRKAANLLSEEFDVVPGSRVGVNLPAAHWRTTYWCLAVWSLGATVVFADSDEASAPPRTFTDVDVLVTNVPDGEFAGDQVIVTLAMLARAATVEVPAGAIDEARELSTFGDVFSPFAVPAPGDVALVTDGAQETFRELVEVDSDGSSRIYLPHPSPQAVMRALAADGGVVVVRGVVSVDDLATLLAQENVSAD